jgi:hypothetical protein
MLHKKERMFDETGRSFIITHNIVGKNINEWEVQFKENETYRKQKRKDSVFVNHDIISFHKKDSKNISLEKMEDMAREYIKIRNPKGMYIAVPHFDKEHYHIHICTSGIEYHTGKSLNLLKSELVNVKKRIQDYQMEKYPELSNSIVQHGKKEKSLHTEKEYQYKQRTGRETNKEQVLKMLNACYEKAISKEDFFFKFKECGLSTYNRNGILTGVLFANRKFRLSRLGFTKEKLLELDKEINKIKELREIRSKRKENQRERGINK